MRIRTLPVGKPRVGAEDAQDVPAIARDRPRKRPGRNSGLSRTWTFLLVAMVLACFLAFALGTWGSAVNGGSFILALAILRLLPLFLDTGEDGSPSRGSSFPGRHAAILTCAGITIIGLGVVAVGCALAAAGFLMWWFIAGGAAGALVGGLLLIACRVAWGPRVLLDEMERRPAGHGHYAPLGRERLLIRSIALVMGVVVAGLGIRLMLHGAGLTVGTGTLVGIGVLLVTVAIVGFARAHRTGRSVPKG